MEFSNSRICIRICSTALIPVVELPIGAALISEFMELGLFMALEVFPPMPPIPLELPAEVEFTVGCGIDWEGAELGAEVPA